ncbi:hypothetical protein INR75_08730 [Zunongwangia sp. SCSIO 43204]|uniref:hypothetical protein n=1 Tax=Zunongwangia sp. SCSIO 43204 TaxID=2779359 RepID=UPI001CA90BBC|nr:hypothetical protein [Zunongwangia sp. SCSIO 43204]UAB86062.1 hypothetical protein INR75_08730 [Zunongwangia sp. SCSIO 43204]
MSNRKKIIDLFQSKGLLFPETEKEVEEFELFNTPDKEEPTDWDAPEKILKRGLQNLTEIQTDTENSLNNEIEELRMVARKGNNLPQHIIDKMKAKHNKDDK